MKSVPEMGRQVAVKVMKRLLQLFNHEVMSTELGSCHWLLQVKRKSKYITSHKGRISQYLTEKEKDMQEAEIMVKIGNLRRADVESR